MSQPPVLKAIGTQKILIKTKLLISIFRVEFLSISLIDHEEFKNLAIEIVGPMFEGSMYTNIFVFKDFKDQYLNSLFRDELLRLTTKLTIKIGIQKLSSLARTFWN